MGYYIKSIFAISPDDKHDFYIYYINPWRLEFGWIDNWIKSSFNKIASSVGPKGVFIIPIEDNMNLYRKSIEEVFNDNFFHKDENARDLLQKIEIIHSGYPFLVFTKSPLLSGNDIAQSILINLAGCENEKSLSKVVDVIIEVINKNDMEIFRNLPDINKSLTYDGEHGNWSFALKDLIILKPNIFGFGIDINNLFDKLKTIWK